MVHLENCCNLLSLRIRESQISRSASWPEENCFSLARFFRIKQMHQQAFWIVTPSRLKVFVQTLHYLWSSYLDIYSILCIYNAMPVTVCRATMWPYAVKASNPPHSLVAHLWCYDSHLRKSQRPKKAATSLQAEAPSLLSSQLSSSKGTNKWCQKNKTTNDINRSHLHCNVVWYGIRKILKIESLWLIFPKQHPQYPNQECSSMFQLLLCPEK